MSEPVVTRKQRPMVLILDHSFGLDLVRACPLTIKKKRKRWGKKKRKGGGERGKSFGFS